MAKKGKRLINKTEEVRKYYAANPDAKAKEVVAALAKQSIKVTEGYVYGIRSKMNNPKTGGKKKAAKGKVGRPAGVKATAGGLTLADIKAVKAIVDKVGSVSKAESALAELKNLQ